MSLSSPFLIICFTYLKLHYSLVKKRFVNGFLQKLVADAGQVGHGEIPILRLQIVFCKAEAGVHSVAGVMLVNYKIGDGALQMQSGVGRQRAARNMNLNPRVKGVCHIADFFHFADAAAVADVGLGKL